MGNPDQSFYRLYGIAMTALLTAYTAGLISLLHGKFPHEVVYMGIVSNLGAAIYLLTTGNWRGKKLSICVFGILGLGFLFSAVMPISATNTW